MNETTERGCRIIRRRGTGWEGIAAVAYASRADEARARAPESDAGAGAPGPRHAGAAASYAAGESAHAGVSRHLLAAPPAASFDVRYFGLDAGAETATERHAHVHVVFCVDGHGRVQLEDVEHEIGPGDVVYVAPNALHRFRAGADAPFGFLCIVDRHRAGADRGSTDATE